jgi:hypothetical protein
MFKSEGLNLKQEEIQLKNIVKTEGFLYRKERFAVLTCYKFLIYKNQYKFIDNKSPKVII